MTKLYANFISQQQSILRGAGLVEAKNPSEVSVNMVLSPERRSEQNKYIESQSTTFIPQRDKAKFDGTHDGPKGAGRIYTVIKPDPKTGQKKVKYFAGNANPAKYHTPGGGGAQGKHTDLHDTPEEAANQFHGK